MPPQLYMHSILYVFVCLVFHSFTSTYLFSANFLRPCTFLIALNLGCIMSHKSMWLLFISAPLYVRASKLVSSTLIDHDVNNLVLCSLIFRNPRVYVNVLVCVRTLCSKPLAHSSRRNLLDVIHFHSSNRCYPYPLI